MKQDGESGLGQAFQQFSASYRIGGGSDTVQVQSTASGRGNHGKSRSTSPEER
ncbi:hypothetical protein RE6C_01934 [Rhodopirellula europaea 6C]|uniref:Uncharacterized protein n=1 Tax=Rhodopirellula europaea 6C TaxID=1263867 RepID=M2A7L1_9BACT|nr:hypothetical protein RE6C_01934 [Rhodopirellula europaea 6C]